MRHGLGRGWEAALDTWTQGRKVWFPGKGLIAAMDGSRAGMQQVCKERSLAKLV